ncbi:MAG: hypothetical protein GY856_20640 [bacterium]|nr:hypothetical protein [bacterium]
MLKAGMLNVTIILMPATAIATLGGAFLFDLWTYTTDASAIRRIEAGLVPGYELGRDLQETIYAIPNLLRDAVTEVDPYLLAEADSRRDALLALLEQGRANEALNGKELQELEEKFLRWYPLVREAALKSIEEGWTSDSVEKLGEAASVYGALGDSVDDFRSQRREDLTAGLRQVLKNSKRWILIRTGFMGIAVCVLITLYILALNHVMGSRAIHQEPSHNNGST